MKKVLSVSCFNLKSTAFSSVFINLKKLLFVGGLRIFGNICCARKLNSSLLVIPLYFSPPTRLVKYYQVQLVVI